MRLLDQSAEAIEASKRNAAANGLAATCSFDTINVFDWLKNNTAVKPHERVIPRFDLIILESAGIGQSDSSVIDLSDVSMYVMTPEFGAASQLEKIDMIDYADLIAINKFDKKGAMDAGNAKVQEWENLMWKYQQAIPGSKPGEKWVLMKKVFDL